MKKSFYSIALIAALALVLAPATFAQVVGPDTQVETEKRGQTGFKFLTVSVDPRATAMGGAVTSSTIGTSTALFYNPASMSRMESNFQANFGVLQYIVDINYNVASLAFRPAGGNLGVVGVSFMSVDYGDFFETVRAENEQGFIETGTYSPTALAIGVGYARSFTDRFSVGAHVKYASQDLGTFAVARTADGTPLSDGTKARFKDYALNTVAVDFGVLYNTGFRSLTIAMNTRNFSRELAYERENFELPLTFQIGASMDMVDFTNLDPGVHALLLAVDAQRPRDFVEHLKIGGEYTFMDLLALRAGWSQAFVGADESEEGISLGAGLKYQAGQLGFGADYAYTNFGLFGNLNRFALQVSF